MEQSPLSIAERHLRFILFGGLGMGALTGLLVAALLWDSDRSALANALIGLASWTAATLGWGNVIKRIAFRQFVRSFRSATLRLEPTTPADETVELSSWLTVNGFDDHGSWMTVGADGVVYGGVGSRLLHRNGDAITAHVDPVQVVFSTALSNGQMLVTTEKGALPHPSLIVQGERGADLGRLHDLHCAGLRLLDARGITAVQPAGGPLETRLQSDTREQESLNAVSVGEGARLLLSCTSLPLEPLG